MPAGAISRRPRGTARSFARESNPARVADPADPVARRLDGAMDAGLAASDAHAAGRGTGRPLRPRIAPALRGRADRHAWADRGADPQFLHHAIERPLSRPADPGAAQASWFAQADRGAD